MGEREVCEAVFTGKSEDCNCLSEQEFDCKTCNGIGYPWDSNRNQPYETPCIDCYGTGDCRGKTKEETKVSKKKSELNAVRNRFDFAYFGCFPPLDLDIQLQSKPKHQQRAMP